METETAHAKPSRHAAETRSPDLAEVIFIGSDDDEELAKDPIHQFACELSQWLRDSTASEPVVRGTLILQHSTWGDQLCEARLAPSAKTLAVNHVLMDLGEVQKRLDHLVEAAHTALRKADAEHARIAKALFDASPYQVAAQDPSADDACWDYYQGVLQGRQGRRIRRVQSERMIQQRRLDELESRQRGVCSLSELLEAKLVGENPSHGYRNRSSQLLEAFAVSVVNGIGGYRTAFFGSWWNGDDAFRRALLAETTAFWRNARFWLPSWARTVIADELGTLSREIAPAAAQVLTPAITPLTWTEELTLLDDDAVSRSECQPSSSHSGQYLETL